jgi:hypothetical protein
MKLILEALEDDFNQHADAGAAGRGVDSHAPMGFGGYVLDEDPSDGLMLATLLIVAAFTGAGFVLGLALGAWIF